MQITLFLGNWLLNDANAIFSENSLKQQSEPIVPLSRYVCFDKSVAIDPQVFRLYIWWFLVSTVLKDFWMER